MTHYQVTLTEKYSCTLTIKADTPEEAMNQAEEMYYNGEIPTILFMDTPDVVIECDGNSFFI